LFSQGIPIQFDFKGLGLLPCADDDIPKINEYL
jgi:hypothetical protein